MCVCGGGGDRSCLMSFQVSIFKSPPSICFQQLNFSPQLPNTETKPAFVQPVLLIVVIAGFRLWSVLASFHTWLVKACVHGVCVCMLGHGRCANREVVD